MANLCLDDVYFYSDEHPERIQELWEDLEASIILSTCKPDDRWFGNILQYKSINTENIYLRGSVCYMTYDNDAILLSMETCWEPLYEAYRVVADTYGVSFVMQSIEPGFEIYENTDETGRFFCDRYSIRYENESFTTPSGQPISQIIECEEVFTSSEAVLERFESAGYHAATLTELKEKLEGTGITIYEFKNSYK